MTKWNPPQCEGPESGTWQVWRGTAAMGGRTGTPDSPGPGPQHEGAGLGAHERFGPGSSTRGGRTRTHDTLEPGAARGGGYRGP
ncbi:unnamed protein product, partial [Staurois parvus]